MDIKLVELTYDLGEKIPSNYGSKLRGYFANRFENILFHNHDKNGKFRYSYPLVQYKIIDNKATLIGINKGAETIISKFLDIDEINLNGKVYLKPSAKLDVSNVKLKVVDEVQTYEFLSPWIALNQKNYKKYITSKDKTDFLKRKLVGNILSFAKGIDWWIEKNIEICGADFEEVNVNYKNRNMLSFKGTFKTNMELPSNIGLGKSVSKGFGRIVRID